MLQLGSLLAVVSYSIVSMHSVTNMERSRDSAFSENDEGEDDRLQDYEDEGNGLSALLQEEGDGGDGARRQDDEGDDSILAFLQEDDDGAVIQENEDGGGDVIEQGFFGRIFSGIHRFGGRIRNIYNRVSRYSCALNCLSRMQVKMHEADEGDDDLARDLLRSIANLQQEGILRRSCLESYSAVLKGSLGKEGKYLEGSSIVLVI